MGKITRFAALAMMVGASVAVMTAPANAATANQIAMTGTYTGVLSPGGATATFECTATAPGAIATAITACHMTTGGPNQTIALPGSAAATAGVASIPLQTTSLCWSGYAVFADASTKSTSGCTLNVGGGTGLLGGGGVSN